MNLDNTVEALRKEIVNLDAALNRLGVALEEMRSAKPISVTDAEGDLRSAMDLAVSIRTAVLNLSQAAKVDSDWSNRNQLDGVIARIADSRAIMRTQAVRAKLSGIADALTAGLVQHRFSAERVRLNEARESAASELQARSADPEPPVMRGPEDVRQWFDWVWKLDEGADAFEVEHLRSEFPRLFELVASVDPTWWIHGSSSAPGVIDDAPSGLLIESTMEPDIHLTPATVPQNGAPVVSHAATDVTSSTFPSPAHGIQGAEATDPSPIGPVTELLPVTDPDSVQPVLESPAMTETLAETVPNVLGTEQRETAAIPKPPLGSHSLPSELRSYEEFANAYWMGEDGHCEPVPWRSPDFATELQRHAHAAAETCDIARLWVFCKAAEQIGASPMFASLDLEFAATVLSAPQSTAMRVSATHVAALNNAAEGSSWRLKLFLAAVAPNYENWLTLEQVSLLLDVTGFSDTMLKEQILKCFQLLNQGRDPVPYIRTAVERTSLEKPSTIEAKLSTARADFRREVRRVWSDAGGATGFAHCRQAWATFMEAVKPLLVEFYPSGPKTWNPDKMAERIATIIESHGRIADAGEVGDNARKMYDRTARLLADKAAGINGLMRQLNAAQNPKQNDVLVDDVKNILYSSKLARPDEELCRYILCALIKGQPKQDPLCLTTADICSCPELVSVLPEASLAVLNTTQDSRLTPVTTLTGVEAAAAFLARSQTVKTVRDDRETIAEYVAAELRERRRSDLVRRLTPLLGTEAKHHVQEEWRAVIQDINTNATDLRRNWRVLDEGSDATAPLIGTIVRQVDALMSGANVDYAIAKEWTMRVATYAAAAADRVIQQIVARAASVSEDTRSAVTRALENHRLAEALQWLGDGPRVGESQPVRETLWRTEAASKFSDPVSYLLNAPHDVKKLWIRGVKGKHTQDRELRNKVVEFAFRARPDQKNTILTQDQNEAKAWMITTDRIRTWVNDQGLNPSCLPQLRRFKAIAVLVADCDVNDAQFTSQASGQVAAFKQQFAIVLAPHLTPARRQVLLKEFRTRNLLGAVIDDLDFCRLLYARDNGRNLPIAVLARNCLRAATVD